MRICQAFSEKQFNKILELQRYGGAALCFSGKVVISVSRAPNEKAAKAKKLFESGMKLVEIAAQLGVPDGTVRRWKSTRAWDNERSDKNISIHAPRAGSDRWHDIVRPRIRMSI